MSKDNLIKSCCDIKSLMEDYILKKTVALKEPEIYHSLFSAVEVIYYAIKTKICDDCKNFYELAEVENKGHAIALKKLAERYSEIAIKEKNETKK